ncbi:MAG: metallophosphatase [Proteobacteria bacterium]|nr:metallophosphatase [Pseudomonadota bacterium]MCP4919882.1 metallophosphatase [Pseudomonadota bacterium]
MITLSLLFAGCAEPSAAEEPASDRLERVVAIGDLHGDLDAALAVLALAGFVDAEGAWSGGTATLVQTGDTTDRGPQSKEVMELVKRLVVEADAAGGRVVPLLGNHEVMNLSGDWRYVHPGDVEGFGGVEGRKSALAADGELGAWLRTLDVVAVVDGVVYTHGGVSPGAAALGLDHWNDQVPGIVLGARPGGLADPDSPIWYRGYLQDPEPEACETVQRALTALSAERMVVGHTTQDSGRVAVRCEGRIVGIDTGISAHYGSNLAAIELRAGDAWALYPSGPVDLADPGR